MDQNDYPEVNKIMEKRKILLIDDGPDILIIFEMILESNNFMVDTFLDPTLALPVYKPFYYDLILMDLNLPDIS